MKYNVSIRHVALLQYCSIKARRFIFYHQRTEQASSTLIQI